MVLFYNKKSQVLCRQWLDSKMVKFVSTINCLKITTVEQQVGLKKETIPCLVVVKKHQEDMGLINKNELIRLHGGEFSAKGYFKKWHKCVYLAILDTMLLHAFFAWNASVDDNNG